MSHAEFLYDNRDNFSEHLTTNIGDVKLSTNEVYGRNGLRSYFTRRCNNEEIIGIHSHYISILILENPRKSKKSF